MIRRLAFASVAALLASVVALASADKKPDENATTKVRLDAIRKAQVWHPTDVASMDLMGGPPGKDSFAPDAVVNCNYLKKTMSGASPKFACVIPPDDELKVKYGRDNGEVFAEVASSRLLWALGFYAERMYPVRVVCRGCPATIQGTELASIQRKLPGKDIETKKNVGWSWSELDLVEPALGGATQAQRDALKLLAVLIQHTDSKPEQQRLICVGKREKHDDAPCPESVMMLHDVGLTFGRSSSFNSNRDGSVNFDGWSRMHIWKDRKHCIANLPASNTGTLENPLITEVGRKFLADLLSQLTDAQLHDLFASARFPRHRTTADNSPDSTSIEQWVGAFKEKRDEIAGITCPG